MNLQLKSQVEQLFSEAINVLANDYQGSSLTDIFVTVDKENGLVSFYDDEDNSVAEAVISEWSECQDLEDEKVVGLLREIAQKYDDEGRFNTLDLYKPFSINYADENMDVIEEILLISDNSEIQLDNELLEKFDREFDEFLARILKE